MLHTTKLLACFLLCFSCFSCDSEKRTSSQNTSIEQIEEQRKSALQQQILLMLRGEVHDENLLRKEIQSLGWEQAEKDLLACIDLHTQEYGKRPTQELVINTHSHLSLMSRRYQRLLSKQRLEASEKDKKKSLQRLEKSIQDAVEREKRERQ